MEQDYMWNQHMMQNKHMDKPMSNTYPWECMDNYNKPHMKDMKDMCHDAPKQMMPIQNMSSKLYGYIYQITIISLNKHLPDKMSGKMPKYISKNDFNLIVNDCMQELTKQDKVYKEMLKSRCIEHYEEEDRVICPYCNGMLKSIVEIALITSLINGGCVFCY